MRTKNLTIMLTDIKGFTDKTASQSRTQTLAMLNTHRDLVLPVIEDYNGRLVKTIGDAFMVAFDSPTDAVLCGVAVQDTLFEYNNEVEQGKRIEIRIAINCGEVTITEGDVYGDPVNITARLESIAEAGQVFFTESVYLAMNKKEVPSSEVGYRQFKGIPEQVKVYKVLRETPVGGESVPKRVSPETSSEGVKTPPETPVKEKSSAGGTVGASATTAGASATTAGAAVAAAGTAVAAASAPGLQVGNIKMDEKGIDIGGKIKMSRSGGMTIGDSVHVAADGSAAADQLCTCRRAGFFARLGAFLIDIIVCGIISGLMMNTMCSRSGMKFSDSYRIHETRLGLCDEITVSGGRTTVGDSGVTVGDVVNVGSDGSVTVGDVGGVVKVGDDGSVNVGDIIKVDEDSVNVGDIIKVDDSGIKVGPITIDDSGVSFGASSGPDDQQAPGTSAIPSTPTAPTPPSELSSGQSSSREKVAASPITIDVNHGDINMVLRMIARKVGVNIIISDDVKGSITMRVVDRPFQDVMNTVVTMHGYDYLWQDDETILVSNRAAIGRLKDTRDMAQRKAHKQDVAQDVIDAIGQENPGQGIKRIVKHEVKTMVKGTAKQVKDGYTDRPYRRRSRKRDVFRIIMWALYCGLFIKFRGATPGKMIFKMQVVRYPDGATIGFWHAAARSALMFISLFAVCLGFLWALWEKDHRTWHDLMAGTMVVRKEGGNR